MSQEQQEDDNFNPSSETQNNKLPSQTIRRKKAVQLCHHVGKPKIGQKGLGFLAASMLSDGADLELHLLICGLSSAIVLDRPDIQEFDDMPSQLRRWIQSQDGLRIDGNPISS
jgi:hypothetical protein